MKKLVLLKIITHFFFLFSCIALAFTPALLIMHFVSPKNIPANVRLTGLDEVNLGSILVILMVIAAFCLYVYALYLFRKVLDMFSRRKIFHEDVIINFNKMGKCIIIATLLLSVPPYLYCLFTRGELDYSFELAMSLDNTLAVCALGLFFMVLGEVFTTAKDIKEENDLTV